MSAGRFVDDFDDDGLDSDYDVEANEEEELSPEDKAAMASGTAEVRKRLGSDASKVTVKQIQDALWHYYYDVEKSVSYLQKTFISPPPPKLTQKSTPKKTSEGMSEIISFSASNRQYLGASGVDHQRSACFGHHLSQPEPMPRTSHFHLRDRHCAPASLYFQDMAWLDTPRHRHTVFVEPWTPRGGLLGGGSEPAPAMSKLQKLAAARKKKSEEKKGQDKAGQATKEIGKLSLSDESQKENEKPALPIAKRQKTSEAKLEPPIPSQGGNSDGLSNESREPDNRPEDAEVTEAVDMVAAEKAAPSAFARTLFGPTPDASRARSRDVFAMPYTLSSSFSANTFTEPSPDDIVLAAQAKAGKKPAAASKPGKKDAKASKEDQAATSVSNLKISDAPPPKSRGLDVAKEFEESSKKRSISFVVVGHVDAGKSTLMGRLLMELKYVEERTVNKYRKQAEKSGKQSFALAWVMDQRSEERDRGVTIDIATNYFETEQTKFTILDAPGHRDFIPNMIAGASQADFAILVIDANTGAYEKGLKGQTREHVLLLRSLGVQRLVIAVNKLDMVGWSRERFDEINQQITGFLNGLGFRDDHVIFIPISGLNGDNIVRPIEDQAASWYSGTTLIEALEASAPTAARALKKPLRMAISEVFRSQQGSVTLAGRIDSGTMQVGDVLVVQPSGETAYIKSIVVDKESQDWAVAGQNVSLSLTDIDPIHIRVGDILCHTKDPIACGDSFTIKAMAFEHLLPLPVDLHRGRLHVPGQIQSIAATLDKATGAVIKKKPKVVQPGGVARVVIKLQSKVPLESGQRVVLRSDGETIAAGLLE